MDGKALNRISIFFLVVCIIIVYAKTFFMYASVSMCPIALIGFQTVLKDTKKVDLSGEMLYNNT
ncbi:hypothetical protein HMPREF3192_00939 [Atopobium deltae]|uniref:Uncharacterized protein n=1 Tax=Atopobium deltae TaxID=1393034 RepID=A0A133XTL7_9ACTN|nr:hypothetical protein HMPREF3192_00939 [Atopobium deltae]